MLLSLALIFLFGMMMGKIFERLGVPRLLGMIVTGIIIGPYALNLIDTSVIDISGDLRKIALIIILTRAGFSLNITDLKKVGRPAVLMCFVPACFEIAAMIFFAPKILGISILDAAVMGAVVGAVSPAVIVPKMITLMEEGYGTKKSIPQLILAGASVDDVFVIVLFTAFTGLSQGGSVSAWSFTAIPISIITGVLMGAFMGIIISKLFKKMDIKEPLKLLIILSISFILVSMEDMVKSIIPFSGLLAVMSLGISLRKKSIKDTELLSKRYGDLWASAEILLFVLVGATVDVSYALSARIGAVILIFVGLIFRMAGVYICFIGTELSKKERIFCMMAYTPKATVQAAIGGMPLAMGLSCGNIVLTVAVLAILITAPLGSFMIEKTYKSLLSHDESEMAA